MTTKLEEVKSDEAGASLEVDADLARQALAAEEPEASPPGKGDDSEDEADDDEASPPSEATEDTPAPAAPPSDDAPPTDLEAAAARYRTTPFRECVEIDQDDKERRLFTDKECDKAERDPKARRLMVSARCKWAKRQAETDEKRRKNALDRRIAEQKRESEAKAIRELDGGELHRAWNKFIDAMIEWANIDSAWRATEEEVARAREYVLACYGRYKALAKAALVSNLPEFWLLIEAGRFSWKRWKLFRAWWGGGQKTIDLPPSSFKETS